MEKIKTKEERIKEYINDPNKINIVHKEIDLLQGVINRLASNSQFCKKISLGFLVSFAPLAQILFAKGHHSDYSSLLLLFGTILATCAFGYMDCKYLMLEKKYRIGYEGIVGIRSRNWAFGFLYCLSECNMDRFYDKNDPMIKITLCKTVFSFSILPFYSTIISFLTLLYWLLH